MNVDMNDDNVYKIREEGQFGAVQIADEVIAIIAGLLWLSVVGQGEKKGKIYLNVFDKLPFEVQTMLYIPALFIVFIGFLRGFCVFYLQALKFPCS